MRLSIIYIVLISLSITVKAQQARIVLQNADYTSLKPTINIKWYSQQFVYKDGVYVYRRDYPNGKWTKLTSQPIKRLPDVAQELKNKDEELNLFVTVIKEAKPEQLSGLILMNLMVESFKSHVFSRFLGIQYDDENIIPGKTYQYKIQKVYDNKELVLAQSDSIVASPFSPQKSPDEYYAKIGKKNVLIGWLPEETRFYGVNVYRKSGIKEIKLNNRPILLSQIPDSTGKMIYPKDKFRDDSIVEGSTYQYSIAGIDFFGKETYRTIPVEIKFPDQTPPPAPGNFDLSVKKYEVTLNWDVVPVSDLKGFYVYRCTNDKDYKRITEEPLNKTKGQYIDKVPGKGNYYYFVTAVDVAGNETASRRQFKEVRDISPPSIPQLLTAKSDTGKIILNWNPNTEADLMGYLLFRQTVTKKTGGDFVLLNAIPTKAHIFIDRLPKNTRNKFLYRIVAIDSAFNKSGYSNIAGTNMPDIKKPEKPYIKNVDLKNDYFTIEWVPNVDCDLKGYDLYSRMSVDEKEPFKKINSKIIPPTVSKYIDKWAIANTPITYYLVAIDSAGNESIPSEYFDVIQNDKNKNNGSKALKLTVTLKGKAIFIDWQLTRSANYIGCVLFRGESKEILKPVTGMLDTDKFNDSNFDITHVYYYQIKTFDNTGIKNESDIVKFENIKK